MAAPYRVSNIIPHECSSITGFKYVFVSPTPIRPPRLDVDKPDGRFPDCDLALPSQRDTVKLQAVVDARAGTHLHGRADDMKVEPGRRYAFQICSAGEKSKHVLNRLGKPLFGFERIQLQFR